MEGGRAGRRRVVAGASLPVGRAGEQNQRGIRQTRRSDGGRSHRSVGEDPAAATRAPGSQNFVYRARPLGDRYLNRMLIPWLCKKAGVPRSPSEKQFSPGNELVREDSKLGCC